MPTWLIFMLRKSISFWGLVCFTSLGSTIFLSSRVERTGRNNLESLAASWDSDWTFDWPCICETSSLATDSATVSSHVLSNEDVLRSSGFCVNVDSFDDWLLGLFVSTLEVLFFRLVPAVVETLKSSCTMKRKIRTKEESTILRTSKNMKWSNLSLLWLLFISREKISPHHSVHCFSQINFKWIDVYLQLQFLKKEALLLASIKVYAKKGVSTQLHHTNAYLYITTIFL